MVPYIQKSGLKLDRVMICWDGSRPAARAIADAMPFLARSAAIDVVIVASGREKSDEIPGIDIGEHLARHGLKVEVKRIVSTDVDVPNTILSHAADTAPISSSWAASAIRACANSCSAARPTAFSPP